MRRDRLDSDPASLRRQQPSIVIGKDRRVTITRAVWFGLGLRTGDRVAVVSDRDADEVRLIPTARLVGRGV